MICVLSQFCVSSQVGESSIERLVHLTTEKQVEMHSKAGDGGKAISGAPFKP